MNQPQPQRHKERKGDWPETDTKTEEQSLISSPEFVNIEANLAALGFFTPSNRRIKQRKSVKITRLVKGQKEEKRVTFVPTDLGLPTAPADQDKYIGLLKIIKDLKREKGRITNPITFTTAELLRLLEVHRDSGKNYEDVRQWLQRMTLTGIISERAIYFANRKEWRSATFHVFESFVTRGHQLEDGSVAEKHHIFLSEWQLYNLNQNYSFPLDWDTYRTLKNHIAKALICPLQIMLYATQEQGRLEKRYNELCQFLGIRQYKYPSLIKQTLGPSLDELKEQTYLKDWKLTKTTDKKAYKIIFWHGEKFYEDLKRLGGREDGKEEQGRNKELQPTLDITSAEPAEAEPRRLAALTTRGIPEDQAFQIVLNLAPNQPFWDQLEYLDQVIKKGTIENPVGFVIAFLKENRPTPPDFISNRQRQAFQEQREAEALARNERQQVYQAYQAREVALYIQEKNLQADYQTRLIGKVDRLRQHMRNRSEEELTRWAESSLRDEIAREIPDLKPEEEFFTDGETQPQQTIE